MAVRGWRYVLADRHPNRCRTLRKYSRIITYHYISMPYGPNFTNKFAIPHVCLYHVYVTTVHSCPNELVYTIIMEIRTPRSKQPYNPNTSRIIRMAIRSIRIHYVSYKLHYVPSSTVRTKRTVREHESEKLSFRYKSRRISPSSPHFLITMKK